MVGDGALANRRQPTGGANTGLGKSSTVDSVRQSGSSPESDEVMQGISGRLRGKGRGWWQ